MKYPANVLDDRHWLFISAHGTNYALYLGKTIIYGQKIGIGVCQETQNS